MKQRINVFETGFNAIKPLMGIGAYLRKSPVEQHLLELVNYRVSQINGCAYCLDMHSKDLLAAGENDQRLHMMSAWREASCFTDRERAALAWAESVTLMNTANNVPDDVYNLARTQFSEQELIDLTMGVIAINSFNRLNVAFRTPAGGYVVGQYAALQTA